ncbi:MAG: tRNA (N(6)-L-threonylcarbamoyladenosine(37)-C(2))-methylthiotransferase MtaB [Candidatus Kaelpia imicola]|nr:tRNA (N(6)-L-threonylcarbamoyladenosine(37)-C(2))-methylthiotransferase MtaB [Candidatus Kaelpia imicola]
MYNFYLKTFGCKLNQYESQLIRENLTLNNWLEVESVEQSDYVLINSCCVTHDAVRELKRFIRSVKRKNSALKIAVLGCLVQLYPQELQDIECDILSNNREKFDLSGNLTKVKDYIEGFKNHTRAFVKVQDGCNNRCSYCCVWMARGSSRSRDRGQVLNEIAALLRSGYKEIVLTGCCLGDFGKDRGSSLSQLLSEINGIDSDFRIRLSSIEPQDVDKELIESISNFDKIVPHLHIPLQSGSDTVLKLMGRKYDKEHFRELVLKLKGMDSFQFSTDIIVGFPGEREEDFKDTIELLKELRPIRVHVFPYSLRPKTAAFELGGKVTGTVLLSRRKEALSAAQILILDNLKEQVGKRFQVLIERKIGNFWVGYSENYIKIKFRGDRDFKNRLLLVKAVDLDSNDSALLAVPLH